MGDCDYYNNEEVDYIFGLPLSSEIDSIEMSFPYVGEITCRLFLYNTPGITKV